MSRQEQQQQHTQVDAASLAFYQEKLNKSLIEAQSSVQQWREHHNEYQQLRDGLQKLPEETAHQVMVPVGPLAFFPGKIVKTNELLVLLGENWFIERSAAQAVEIVDRRLETVQQQLETAEKRSKDIETRIKLSGGLGDLTGYPINEDGQQVVEIREEYHSDDEDKFATTSTSKTSTGK
ncbi:Prefoldin [Syncephalis fuscata]|nr:Prefoldin [Syncephalis fuscata]